MSSPNRHYYSLPLPTTNQQPKREEPDTLQAHTAAPPPPHRPNAESSQCFGRKKRADDAKAKLAHRVADLVQAKVHLQAQRIGGGRQHVGSEDNQAYTRAQRLPSFAGRERAPGTLLCGFLLLCVLLCGWFMTRVFLSLVFYFVHIRSRHSPSSST